MGRRPTRIAEPTQREPVQGEREQPEEDETDPERGHVVEEETAHDDAALAEPTSTPRDERTNDHADQILDDDRSAEQEEGTRKSRRNHIANRFPFDKGIAKVQAEHVPDELAHPDEIRIVNPERLVEMRQPRAIKSRIRPKPIDRCAGHQIEKDEDDYGDDQQGDDALNSPFHQVPTQGGHTVPPSLEWLSFGAGYKNVFQPSDAHRWKGKEDRGSRVPGPFTLQVLLRRELLLRGLRPSTPLGLHARRALPAHAQRQDADHRADRQAGNQRDEPRVVSRRYVRLNRSARRLSPDPHRVRA